jgi:hypothetical protein
MAVGLRSKINTAASGNRGGFFIALRGRADNGGILRNDVLSGF